MKETRLTTTRLHRLTGPLTGRLLNARQCLTLESTPCPCPVLAAFLGPILEHLDTGERTERLVARLSNTSADRVTARARAFAIGDYVTRLLVPLALDAASHHGAARDVRSLDAVADRATAAVAYLVLAEAIGDLVSDTTLSAAYAFEITEGLSRVSECLHDLAQGAYLETSARWCGIAASRLARISIPDAWTIASAALDTALSAGPGARPHPGRRILSGAVRV